MAKRRYENEDIIVYWDSDKCCHSGNCVRGLPGVFKPLQRPWVNLANADCQAIKRTIETCPSGALRCKLKDKSRASRPDPGR